MVALVVVDYAPFDLVGTDEKKTALRKADFARPSSTGGWFRCWVGEHRT